MSLAAIVELVCLCLAVAGMVWGANERIERTFAEHARAEALNRVFELEHGVVPLTDWDRHVADALEQAEPGPDLKGVR